MLSIDSFRVRVYTFVAPLTVPWHPKRDVVDNAGLMQLLPYFARAARWCQFKQSCAFSMRNGTLRLVTGPDTGARALGCGELGWGW